MKIVLRYPGDSGFLISKPLNIESNEPTVEELLDIIDRAMSFKKIPFFVKIQKDGISVYYQN